MDDNVFDKAPTAELPYSFDWKADGWLPAGVTISSYALTPLGVTISADQEAEGVVTFLATGGTLGKKCSVRCDIVRSDGYKDSRTIYLNVVNR